MKMTIEVKPFPLHEPFVITGYTFHVTEVVWVTLTDGDAVGRGEAVGSYYLDETATVMATTLESVKADVEAGATRADVQQPGREQYVHRRVPGIGFPSAEYAARAHPHDERLDGRCHAHQNAQRDPRWRRRLALLPAVQPCHHPARVERCELDRGHSIC